jgi:hypothetical protein
MKKFLPEVGVMRPPTPDEIVRIARNKGYTPAQLAACFNNMELHIAESLLRFRLHMTEEGKLHAHPTSSPGR